MNIAIYMRLSKEDEFSHEENNNVHPEGWEKGRLPDKLDYMSFKGNGEK